MTKLLRDVPLSVLDFASYSQGQTVADGLAFSRDLAIRAERMGYARYWLAEHHNAEGVGSAATAVLISHLAAETSRIRVGSGGIMLPNHSPYLVAEQFGTLGILYPDRIDLGLGRALGTDQQTARAVRGGRAGVGQDFGDMVQELAMWMAPPAPRQPVLAIPGAGVDVPIWILGSSTDSAALAARLGRPYAFAGHFSPAQMLPALALYRERFTPSDAHPKPYVMVAAGVVAAEDDARGEYLATSMYQRFAGVVQGIIAPLPAPVETMGWGGQVEQAVRGITREMIIGGPDTVARGLQDLLDRTDADELIISSDLFNHEDRVRSYEIVAEFAFQPA